MSSESLNIAWMLIAAVLVMLMQLGFCFLESGLVRAKNSINVAIKNISDFCVSTAIFWLFGFGIMFGSSYGGWLGTNYFMIEAENDWWLMSFFVFELVFCGTAITIISGAVAERMRFQSYLIIAGFTSGIIYPFLGHWAWAGTIPGTEPGWLAARGFIDFAGSTVVHSVGGWVSLAAILVIGPRIGQFDDPKRKIQGHNLTMASGGVMLLWVGWIGFNGGSTFALNHDVPKIIANTIIAGAFGGISCMAIAYYYHGLARTGAVINGIIGGLVSITAACHVVSTLSATIIGSLAGILCFYGMRLLDRYKIDDAVGAVPAHAFCGVWGTLCVALFGQADKWNTGLNRLEQFVVQIEGILTCFIWAFGGALLFFYVLNKFIRLRVTEAEEKAGLNVSEHGATTELIDLIKSMEVQEKAGSFKKRVYVEPHTEVGQIAAEYNRVLNRIEDEFKKREIATDEARQSQAAAIRANEVKSSFLANMSHELRTPLGIITGYVELIKEDLQDAGIETHSEDLDTIANASQHLLHLINGVLDISKIEAGQMTVYLVPIELEYLIHKLAQTLQPLIDEKNNKLIINCAKDIGTLVTDEVKIQQCLLNLISNAAKFTENGLISLNVYKGRWNNGIESIYFEVKDTGIGIPKEQLNNIFKAFTQADDSTTRRYGGTGLGLTITRSFCNMLGGEITVESKPSEGACFTMRLPNQMEPQETPKRIHHAPALHQMA